jgi:hydroxylaminobenzene mutase
LLVGVAVPAFAVPRLGLSTHLLGQGIFLMVIGVLWPRLRVTRVMARIGVFLAVYGCFAAWTANLSAAIWSAGNSMLPIAAGPAHGSSIQEGIIAVALRSAAVSLIAVSLPTLWGLRAFAAEEPAA